MAGNWAWSWNFCTVALHASSWTAGKAQLCNPNWLQKKGARRLGQTLIERWHLVSSSRSGSEIGTGAQALADEEQRFWQRESESRAKNMPSKDVLASPIETDRLGASAARRRGFQREEIGRSSAFYGVSRACAISLVLWASVVCVLLGAATGYRPLKEKVLSFDNSPWLNEVRVYNGFYIFFRWGIIFEGSDYRVLCLVLGFTGTGTTRSPLILFL